MHLITIVNLKQDSERILNQHESLKKANQRNKFQNIKKN